MTPMAALRQKLPLQRGRRRKIRARAGERSCDLCESSAQRSGSDIYCLARAGVVAGSEGHQRATSNWIGAIAGGFWIPFFSPLFWILAVSSFVLFLTASRLGNKVLRVLLFWIPTLFVSALGFGLVALFTYGWMHFRKG